jgi:serine/threonine protein kinase
MHRDIKLENIIRTPLGIIKLIDFGLAEDLSAGRTEGQVGGSPCYLAPEILRWESYGPSVDMFSLGSVVYALVFGKLPFKGVTVE